MEGTDSDKHLSFPLHRNNNGRKKFFMSPWLLRYAIVVSWQGEWKETGENPEYHGKALVLPLA